MGIAVAYRMTSGPALLSFDNGSSRGLHRLQLASGKMIPMTPEPKAWISFVCNRSPESHVPWILEAMPSLTSITILGQGPVSPATEICLGIWYA